MGWLLEGDCVREEWGTEGLVLSGLDRERNSDLPWADSMEAGGVVRLSVEAP